MTGVPLTPRARAKRERIHQAAQRLFMQLGFEATSMDAIAEAAAVSKPTLYRYYQSKEALFIAVLEHLALHQLSEDALLVLRDRPMDSLATLEQALAVGARFAQAVPQQGEPTSRRFWRMRVNRA